VEVDSYFLLYVRLGIDNPEPFSFVHLSLVQRILERFVLILKV
jgi:hypothetical protein